MRCSALQCVAVRCSALQCVAVRCSALQCVAAYCSVYIHKRIDFWAYATRHIIDTPWRRYIEYLKLQVSFRKRATTYRALLQKMKITTRHIVDTRRRGCIKCLKLQVSFRKRATNYGALFREMTCNNKESFGSSPPSICVYISEYMDLYLWMLLPLKI